MSLILEALRKSEAERHGERVDPLLPAATRKSPPYLLLAMIALLLVTVAVVLKLYVFTGDSEPDSTATVELENSRIAKASAPGPAMENSSQPDNQQTTEIKAPPSLPPPTQPEPRPAPIDQSGLNQVIAVEEPESAQPSETQIEAEPEPDPVATVDLTESIQPDREVAALQPAPRNRSQPEEDSNYLPFSVLSGDQLERVGSMTLNVHVYAEDPADRFVLMNLRRFHEGDQVGQTTLVEILPEGVVLEFEGRQYLMPAQRPF